MKGQVGYLFIYNESIDVALQPRQLHDRLFQNVVFQSNVLVHWMLFLAMFIEVDSHSLELFPFVIAYEAIVVIVFFYFFLLSSHICKRVDDDS